MYSFDCIMKEHIPCYSSISKQIDFTSRKKSETKRPKKIMLTEIDKAGNVVLKDKTTISAALKKLHDYEATGFSPYEIINLEKRANNLEKRVEKLEGWTDET